MFGGWPFAATISAIKERRDIKEVKEHKRQASSISKKRHQRQSSSVGKHQVPSSPGSKKRHHRQPSSVDKQQVPSSPKCGSKLAAWADVVTKAKALKAKFTPAKPNTDRDDSSNDSKEDAEKRRAEALLRLINIADTQAKGAPEQGRVRIDSKDPTDDTFLDYYLEDSGGGQADETGSQVQGQILQQESTKGEPDNVMDKENGNQTTESRASSGDDKIASSTLPTTPSLPPSAPKNSSTKPKRVLLSSKAYCGNWLSASDYPDRFRSDWKTLKKIGHYEFKQILSQHLEVPDLEYMPEDIDFIHEANGGYNYVRLYRLKVGPRAGNYAIKVPSIGTRKAGWCERDGYMLRSEYATMKYIFERSKCPIPEPIGYNASLENDLTAPYIIIRGIKGVPAAQIWFESELDENGERLYNYGAADEPSEERKKLRDNLMSSLAKALAELRTIEFKETGRITFEPEDSDDLDSVTIGPAYFCAPDPNAGISSETDSQDGPHNIPNFPGSFWLEEQPAYASFDFWLRGLRLHQLPALQSNVNELGIVRILQTLLNGAPFNFSSTKGSMSYMDGESFVLRHADLNLHNIYCDEATGCVTGILDWQDAHIVPFCIGWACSPLFLLEDWFVDYTIRECIHAPWVLNEYRDFYAEALVQATGEAQTGRVARGSGVVAGVFAALFGGCARGERGDVVRKILGRLGGLAGSDASQFIQRLGVEQGEWRVGEKWLTELLENFW